MRLKIGDLEKEFSSMRGSIVALDKVSLEIEEGEFFVLLGPSGCGKSTLLNVIAGLENPTRGQIWFDDKLVASSEKGIFLTPKERNVAMVFQSYALYPHLNVFENIAFPLRIVKAKENTIRDSVNKAASMLGIDNLYRAKPAELSGGQRQRVAIARAMVREPQIFLLDEPLSNLDAQLRLSTRSELKNLQRKLGITTVYVTHDQMEAMALGDRIAILKDGRIEQLGSSSELYEKPKNTFVAKFIGSPSINLLEASLVKEEGIFNLAISDKRVKIPDITVLNMEMVEVGSCIFGIRPEDINIKPEKTGQALQVKIDSIEPLGRETLFYFSIGEKRLSALSRDAELKEGELVNVEFDLQKAHFFAPGSGIRIKG